MKKIFITLMVIFITTVAFCESTEQTYQAKVDIGDNTKELIELGYSDLKVAISKLADGLDISADKILPLYVKEARIKGEAGRGVTIFIMLISLVFSILGSILLAFAGSDTGEGIGFAIIMIFGFIFVASIVSFAVCYSEWYSLIHNSELRGIKMILEDIQGFIK